MPELVSGVKLSVARNGLDLYLKAMEKLRLYALTTYKNGVGVWKSMKQEQLITFAPHKLDEKPMATQTEVWRIHANDSINREDLLEANLEVMYTVVLSICDPVLKDQVCNHEDYKEIDNKQDILNFLKKLMYSNVDHDTHMGYNRVIVITNYYHVQLERYQSLQEYHDQFMAYRKVCKQLGLKVGTSENGRSNMLKITNTDNPTKQQKFESEKKATEEHHAILFMLGADK
jgi:hypothetical protein